MKTFHAPLPTAAEKRLVGFYRAHRTAERNGPYFMESANAGRRNLAEFNAFEDVATYSNKRAKRTGGLPDLKKLPIGLPAPANSHPQASLTRHRSQESPPARVVGCGRR